MIVSEKAGTWAEITGFIGEVKCELKCLSATKGAKTIAQETTRVGLQTIKFPSPILQESRERSGDC